jgi:hypothetical protein
VARTQQFNPPLLTSRLAASSCLQVLVSFLALCTKSTTSTYSPGRQCYGEIAGGDSFTV